MKNIRKVGFAKGVLEINKRTDSLLEVIKSALKELEVSFADVCCDESFTGNVCPKISQAEGNTIVCDENGMYAPSNGFGPLFGVAGQDTTAAANRAFSLETFSFNFDIPATPGNTNKLNFGDPNNVYTHGFMSISDVYFQASDPANPGSGHASMELGTNVPFFDLFTTDGSVSANNIELYAEPGYLNLFLGNNVDFEIDGVDQDNNSTMLLALDGSNFLKWVDKSSISGFAPAFTVLNSTFFSPNFDDSMQSNILASPLMAANTRFKLELYGDMFPNGGMASSASALLSFDIAPASCAITYELLCTNPDDVSQVQKSTSFGGGSISTEALFSLSGAPIDRLMLRVTATFVTGASPTTASIGFKGNSVGGNWTMAEGTFFRVEAINP